MNRPLVAAAPPTRGWLYYFATLGAIVVVLSGLAAYGVVTDNAQNREQDRLLGCFDDYAKTQSNASTEVRKASTALTEAQATEGMAFEVWIGLLTDAFETGDQSPEAVAAFAEATVDLRQATTRKNRANEVLTKAREDNPVPDPPSEFCD